MTNIYHATPYDISAMGFYFQTYDDYVQQAASHTNENGDHVEEYEIQYIDGDTYKLFEELGINQANLSQWFDDFEDMDGDDVIKAIYLSDYNGCGINDVLEQLDDVMLFEGTALEYAEQYIEDTGMLDEIPESLRNYFNTEAFARDMVLGGDITEIIISGTSYVMNG